VPKQIVEPVVRHYRTAVEVDDLPGKSYSDGMLLTSAQFRENLVQRFAKTYDEDERIVAELLARMPEAVELIIKAVGPRRVVLFDSLATGIFLSAHSDVDLAVDGIGVEAPHELVCALRELFGRRIDLVDTGLVAAHVLRDIKKRGVVLYEPTGQDADLDR